MAGVALPWKQPIQLGDVGTDVAAVKHALKRLRSQEADKITQSRKAGPVFIHCLKAWEHNHHLKEDGVYGPDDHATLRPHFDLYERWLYRIALLRKHPPSDRQRIIDYCDWAEPRHRQWHYAEIRPIPNSPYHLPMTTDCSGYATLAYKAALLPDPNGMGYDGAGYTGTLLGHGRVIQRPQLQPGDLVFYDNPEHVAIYRGAGMISEHGTEGEPRRAGIDYRVPTHFRSYLK